MRKKTTTIQVDHETKELLNALKIIEREPYDAVLRRVIAFYNEHDHHQEGEEATDKNE